MFALDVADGVVQTVRSVVNPDKLRHIGPVSDVARLPEKELGRGSPAAPHGPESATEEPPACRHCNTEREETMSDFQAIADRVEIEALRGEFTDAVMMRDYDRVASLFTPDGVLRMPNIPAELAGREEIRAWGERVQALVDFFVQNHAPGHDPAGRRHRVRPCLHPRARARPRRQVGAELRHLPRPLPAHRRRLEVHRARLRGQVPRHHSAGGLGPPRRGRPLTRRPGTRRRKDGGDHDPVINGECARRST